MRRKVLTKAQNYQVAPEEILVSVQAAGKQYDGDENMQYASPITFWRSPVVTLYLDESTSHPVPFPEKLAFVKSAALIV